MDNKHYLRLILYEKDIKLNKEEKDILREAKSGAFTSIKQRTKTIAQYATIAKNTTAKNKTISIRISEIDLMKLKAKAAQEGMPYQILISPSLHKLTN